MTINAEGVKYSADLKPIGFSGFYKCVWFEKTKNYSAEFAENALELVDPNEEDTL